MKKKILYGCWVVLYLACAIASAMVSEPTALQQFALVTLSLLFFVPPVLLMWDAYRQEDQKTLFVLRWISGLSLLLTVVLLVANVVSALGSEALGNVLYVLLAVVSVPMISSGYWFISLFVWACIFFASLGKKGKKQKK